MSDAELSEKFRECAAWGGLPRDQAEAVLALLWKVEQLAEVGELTRALASPSPR